ncbi:hypothetical protein PTKIN_Ptkin16aG0485000 [Pterospermum kingtungense]
MSWLRTSVYKAVEVGNQNNLTVVHHRAGQAVAEGDKLFRYRTGLGSERVILLRRWLVSLKEIDKLFGG